MTRLAPVRSADVPVVVREPIGPIPMTPRLATSIFLARAILAIDFNDPCTFPGAFMDTEEGQL